MALAWTTIDLPWGAGVDDKRHPYLNELPKAESLVNLRFQRTGALTARNGVTSLGGPAQDPDVMWTWNNTLTQSANATWLLDQPNGNWRQIGFSGPRAVEVAQRPILRTQEGASTIASAVANGHALYAWSQVPGGDVYVIVRNVETGVAVYGPTTVAGLDVTAPYQMSLRALTHENNYVSVFASAGGSSVASVTFNIASDGTVTVGAATTHAATNSTHYEIHTEPSNSQVYLVTDNGANLRIVRLLRSALTLAVDSAATLSGATSLNSPLGVCLVPVAGHVVVMSTSAGAGAGNIQAWLAPANVVLTASISAAWSVTPAALVPNVQRHIRCAAMANGSCEVLLDGVSTLSPYNLLATPAGNIPTTAAPNGVWRISLDSAGNETPGTDALWHVYLGGSPIEWDGALQAVLIAADVIQSESGQDTADWITDPYGSPNFTWSRSWASRRVAYLTRYAAAVQDGARRVAELGHDVVSFATPVSPTLRSSLASVPRPYVSDATLVLPAATVELGSSRAADIGIFANPTLRSLREYRLTYNKVVATGEVSGLGMVASGYLACLDGDRLGETMMAPPVLVDVWVDRTTSGARTTVTGTSSVEWRACWEWRDAHGLLHRSAPSESIRRTAVNDGTNTIAGVSARVAIPPFIDAAIKSGCLPKDVRIVFYASPQTRTPGAEFSVDDTYWAQIPTYGEALESIRDATYPWMTLRVGVHNPDRTAPSGDGSFAVLSATTTRPLYTNGDVLENDPPVSPLHMATTRERVWIIDAENRERVYYTKPLNTAEAAPEFNAALYVEVPTEAGELVALGSIDDLVVFFSAESIYILDTADAGPDSTGAGTWSPLRRVSREVGCINAATVATTDVGIFFASASGVYLMAPTGQLTWVGRDLGDTVDWSTCVSAAVVQERKEVVFAFPTGTYVFDYDHAQWSTTVYTGADGPTAGSANIAQAESYGGELVLASTEGIAWQEDSASTEGVIYQARTGWIHLAGLQGFQRVRRFGLLGRIAFDPLIPAPPFEMPLDLGALSIRVIYDYDETQFEDYSISLASVYDRLDPMRLRFHLSRQKCQALAFRFTYTPPIGNQQFSSHYGRPELVGLALEVGTKRRLYPRGHALGYTPT